MTAKIKLKGGIEKYNFGYIRDDKKARSEGLVKIGQTTNYNPVSNFHELDLDEAKEVLIKSGFTYEDGVYELKDEALVQSILENGRYSGETASQLAADFKGYRLFLDVTEDGHGFTDKNIHEELKAWHRPKYAKKETEWFNLSPDQAIRAVKNFIRNEPINITSSKFTSRIKFDELTEPQQNGVAFVANTIKNNDVGLLDCVMRFGKTSAALHGVLKAAKESKTLNRILILSHITNTAAGWVEDSLKVFDTEDIVIFTQQAIPSKLLGHGYPIYRNLQKALEVARETGKILIAFNSIQQGKFETDKDSSLLLETHWNTILIDEAHRGTRTDNVAKLVEKLKYDSKIEISGTPFNIGSEYKLEQVFSFNYFQELAFKEKLRKRDYNTLTIAEKRMLELPDMDFRLLGYQPNDYLQENPNGNIADIFSTLKYNDEDELKIENEIERIKKTNTYKKLANESQELAATYLLSTTEKFIEDKKLRPLDFKYRKDVENFLRFLMEIDSSKTTPFHFDSIYKEEGVEIFKHTFWFLPTAASAIALKSVMEELTIPGPLEPIKLFGKFKIYAAAYDEYKQADFSKEGQEKIKYADDIEAAQALIKNNEHTIVVSYQKLGVGTTFPEVTAVLMLNKSEDAKNYLQQAFRSKTPYYDPKTGFRKTKAYVFDILPERLFKLVGDVSVWAPGSTIDERISNSLKLLKIQKEVMKIIDNKEYYVFNGVSYEEVAGVIHKKFEETLQNGKFGGLDLSQVSIELSSNSSSSVSNESKVKIDKPNGEEKPSGVDEAFELLAQSKANKSEKTEEELEAEAKRKESQTLREWVSDCFNLMKFMFFASEVNLKNILSDDLSLNQNTYKSELLNIPKRQLIAWFGKDGENFFNDVLFKIPNYELYIIAWAKSLRALKRPDNELELVNKIMEFFEELSHIKVQSNFIITPIKVARLLADNIDHTKFTKSSRIIDPGCKEAMPLLEMYRRVLSDRNDISEYFKDNIYSIPMNEKAHSLLKAVYNLLKWNKDNIIWLEDQFSSLFGVSEIAREELRHNNAYLVALRLQDKMSNKLKNSIKSEDLKKIDKAICKKFSEIYNLKDKEIMEIQKLIETFKDGKAKFEVAVSNPPYQAEGTERNGSDTTAENIFHYFYETSMLISESLSMIFPGGRWMQKSKGCEGIYDLIVNSANIIQWYPNGDEKDIERIFPSVGIADGISIVSKINNNSIFLLNGISLKRPENKEILPLTANGSKIIEKIKLTNSVNEHKLSSGTFGLRSFWVEKNPNKVTLIENKPINLNDPIRAFLGDEVPGKAKRVKEYWINRSCIDWTKEREDVFKQYKICVSQGQASKRPATAKYFLVTKDAIVGETWLIVRTFNDKVDGENFIAYISSKFSRFLLEESRGAKISGWGSFVPDLEDYTNNNPLFKINEQLSKDHEYYGLTLDERLYKYFNLTDAEISIIKNSF